MHARERRQVRMFVRRDTYGRYVSVPGLPAPRPLQHHRPRAVRRRSSRSGSAASRSSSPSASTSPRPPGSTSWCTRRKGGHIVDVDTADLERRLTEASRSWRDDFTDRRDRGVRRGGRRPARPAATSTPSPRPTRRTSRPAPPRSTSAGWRRCRGRGEGRHRPLALRADGRRPRRGPAQGVPVGPPLSLSEILPMLSSMGVEVVDERPYELEGLGRPTYIYEFGLRYGRALPAARPRAVPGRAARGVGRLQRDRRLQRAGARRRAHLAPGDRAPRLREVHEAGQLARSPSTTSRTRCATTSTSPGCWCSCSRPGSTRAATAWRPTPRPGPRGSTSSRPGSAGPSTTWPASTTTGSCAPT